MNVAVEVFGEGPHLGIVAAQPDQVVVQPVSFPRVRLPFVAHHHAKIAP